MQDFYRCAPGEQEKADEWAKLVCHKRVKDLHYEARVQAVVDYWADKGIKYTKEEARTMYLTREQYMEVNVQLSFG